ncbi:hypothetical protein DOY81_011763 [Sarcophaga bullata]|nr:hypothetical protein DOY81_011763 [Sarcophaga bullata]
MKFFFILALGCLAVSAFTFDENGTRIHGANGWYVPQKNGSFIWTDKNDAEAYLEAMESGRILGLTTPVNFYLYTKTNSKKGYKITANAKSVNASNFNPAKPTRFVIHGWLQNHFSSMNKNIRDAWLSSDDCNVIVVDWSSARSAVYATSVWAVPKVGQRLANMIDFLVQDYNMPLHNLIIIGHSLGAHVAGYAGKYIKTGQIHTIVGLDPALPLFSYDKPDKRLSSTDAFYVESIHTNGGIYGFLKPIGKGAFYPNGGKSQPGCAFDILNICAHERSITYYTEAVARNSFAALKCNSFKEAVTKDCNSTHSPVRMGDATNSLMVEGLFYVPVNKKSPFGRVYPNGGKSQPVVHSIFLIFVLMNVQSLIIPKLLLAIVLQPLSVTALKEAVTKDCNSTHSPVRMGAATNSLYGRGLFYVPVNKKSPFGVIAITSFYYQNS